MTLYIVSVPIGNMDDITKRAIDTFKRVDFLICEEFKIARKLLKYLNIDKELINLNEHNESTATEEIISLLIQKKSAALFSDAGTPLFADPGTQLVKRCHDLDIDVVPIPGPSSLMSALSVAGVNIDQFFFAGFLPRQTENRRREIIKLKDRPHPIVILDTPYRLSALMKDLLAELTPDRRIVLALSLTKSDEQIIRDSVANIAAKLRQNPIKKEFVLIIEPLNTKRKSKKHVKSKRRRR
jgi:16S rRNA (cytidine1402-2'-O)-methyltransferase